MAARRCVVLALALVRLRHHVWRSVRRRAHTRVVPPTGVILSRIWLFVAPFLVWATATLYVPLIAPFLLPRIGWIVTLITAPLIGASLLGHVWAHVIMARLLGSARAGRVPLYPFGDAAQVWPAARTPLREAMIALSGPVFNVVVAYVAYWVWDQQWHVYSNVIMPLVAVVNLVMAVINLAPGFPLDGGRLVRAILWGLLGRPALGSCLGRRLGYGIPSALLGWGLLLLVERARFGAVTGWSTVSIALLLV